MNPESIVTANSAAGAATIASSGLAVAPARWAVRLVFCVLALLMICGKAQAQNLASTFQVQQPDLTFVEGVSRTVRMTAATPGNFEGEALPLGRYHFYLGAAEAYHANFENLIRFPAGGVTFSASGVVLSFGSDMSEQTSAVSPGDTNYGINTFDPFYTTSTAGDNRLFVYDTISPAWNGTYTWANDGELDGEIGTTFTITVLPFAFPDGANPGDQILAKTEMATFTLGNIETTADIESYTLTAGGTVNGVAVAQRIITHGDTIISGAGGGLVYISESGAQTGGGVAAEGSLSGTPNVDADITLTYTAYAAGASKSFAFRIQLYGPSFPTPQENLAFTAGIASPPITFAPVRTSTESVTYTLTRIDGAAIPAAAFSIFRITDAVTEINSETALTVDDAGMYRLTATDNNGETATSDFTIAVSPPVAFPSDASPGNVVLFQGAAVTFSLGNAAGGQSPIVYTLTSNGNVIADGASLPFGIGSSAQDVGITYSAGTPGRILGTPGMIDPPIAATYTATDANGSTDNFIFSVASTAAAFPQPTNVVASYTVNEGAYTIDGVAEFDDAFTLPEVNFTAASATATYSSGGTLATGLTRTLNLISGTPTVAGAFTYLYIAHRTDVDTANVATFNYIAHVAAAPSFPANANPGAQTLLQGAAAVTVTLGNAVGGVAPYAYETLLISAGGTQGGDELVAGSSPFEAVQAYIAATASTPAMVVMSYNIAAEYTFIHNVNDSHAVSAAFTFAFTIEPDAPKFAPQADLHYTAGHSQSRNLVASPSGTAPLAYTITRLLADDTVDMLPAGFTNISIPEQPSLRSTTALTEAMAGSYILTAMDSAATPLSGSVTFNVVVAPPLVAGANPGDTVVQVLQPFNVDMGKATGGRAPLRYEFRRNGGILGSGYGNDGVHYDLRGAGQPAHLHSKFGSGPGSVTTWRVQFRTIDANGASSEIAFVFRAVNAPTFGDGTSPPGSVNVTYTVNDPTRTSDDGSTSEAAIVLPAATGGAGGTTYSVEGTVPGLGLNIAEQTNGTAHLSGTPTTVGDYTFIRIGGDTNNQFGTYTVNIRVNERPSFVGAQPLLQTTLNIPLAEPLTLLAATNGSGDFSYTLDASLPTGLTFSGRTISGTPTVAADARTFDFTMSAVDAHGVTASNTLPFKLEIIPALAFVTPPMERFAFISGQNVAYTLPAASNGNPAYTYSLVSLVDTGLMFDADPTKRILSGDIVAGVGSGENYNYTANYTVRDADGTEVTAEIRIAAFGALNFDGMLGTALNNGYSFRTGTAVNIQLPEAAAGTSTKTYSLTAGASFDAAQFNQDGIAFNPANRRITGTPNNVAEVNYALTYHATDIAGGNTSISTHTNVFIAAELRFLRAADSASVSTFSPINLTLPQVENSVGTVAYLLGELVGGTVNYSSYTLPGTGATQVTFDSAASPQTIGGVTDGTVSAQTFVYTATDNYDGESVSTTFTIAVNESPAFSGSPFVVTYTLGEDTFTRGGIQYNELTLPAATEGVSTGSGTAGYTRDGNLPSGLSPNTSSDAGVELGIGKAGGEIIITGRPSTSGDFIFYRIATDSLGEPGTFTLNIHVAERPAFIDEFETIGFTVGKNDTEHTLPEASGGAGILTYNLDSLDLPAGLTVNLTERTISGMPTKATTQQRTWRATDINGVQAPGRFTLRVAAAFTEIVESDELTAEIEVGESVDVPGGTGGQGPYSFTVIDANDLTEGVEIAVDGTLINTPIFATTAVGTAGEDLIDVVSYTVTDANGAEVTVTYEITYDPIAAPESEREYVIPTGSETIIDLSNAFTVAGGGKRTFALIADSADSGQSASGLRTAAAFVPAESVEVASGLTFDPATQRLTSDGSFGDGTEPTLTYKFVATFTVGTYIIGTGDETVTSDEEVTITLSIDRADELTPINTQVLSKFAAASVAGTLGAITDRIATANIAVPEFSIGGKSPQAALAHGAQLYVNDRENFDRAKLIGNSRFVMPITAAGDPSQSIWASGAVWGSANYRSIDGDANKDNEDKLDWRGTVNGLHLGFDVNVHKNVLFGLAFSRTDGNIDYTLGETAEKGEYEITINSVYPYLNWQLNAANVWASVGSGSGEVVITRPNAAGADNEFRSDIDLIGFGMGVSNDVSEHFELRAELRGGEFQIQGGNEKDVNRLHEQQIKTNTARLLARWHDTNVRADSNSAFMEFGLRSDGGDGSTGTAAEGALGWKHFGQITSLEIAAHGLFGRRDYHEWGAYGQFRMANGADGQGLGLRVRPSYGEAEREFGRLWDTELIDDLSPSALDSDDYQWRTESRLSYGIQSARGLIAPFGEIVSADDDIYRLGVDWTPRNLWMRHIDLNLTGEQHNRENSLDERRVLLQGEVKF